VREFFCESCKMTFENDQPLEEVEQEAIDTFGAVPEDKASLCDDCYKHFMIYYESFIS